jgi:hypothetical protein
MKHTKTFNDSKRPAWQAERGPRFGNKRKGQALLKVKQRRSLRSKEREVLLSCAGIRIGSAECDRDR